MGRSYISKTRNRFYKEVYMKVFICVVKGFLGFLGFNKTFYKSKYFAIAPMFVKIRD